MKTSTQKLFALMILLYLFISADSHATKWIINVQNFSFSPASLPLFLWVIPCAGFGSVVHHTTTSTTIPRISSYLGQPDQRQ